MLNIVSVPAVDAVDQSQVGRGVLLRRGRLLHGLLRGRQQLQCGGRGLQVRAAGQRRAGLVAAAARAATGRGQLRPAEVRYAS